ncbi:MULTISPECIES: peptidoglycan-binding protein [unclassified Streptomyces]|uniref:peptidoglycan-binding protein n=1 Tax=unclassified Streptomyces TaxID=2593676 RepID=UPI0013BD15CF|nr:peptidoglycan-binding protein [Streptomyces sp. SID14446]NEB28992.1 helix-turn-helix domain-containing protein [Streptomyces sp. SID14446]
MSRWKALPAELDPRVRQLLVRLRRLKDHNGLTMRQLAARTGYSAKSWERYLGGRSVPPRDAVEAMARIGGEDPTRLLALHEVAVAAWRDRPLGAPEQDAPEEGAAGHAVTEPAPTETVLTDAGPSAVAAVAPVPAGAEAAAPEPEQVTTSATRAAGEPRISRRALSIALVSGSVALVLAASAAVFVAVRIMDDDKGGAPAPAGHASTAAAPPAATKAAYSCHLERADGHWYAGNSRATDSTVAYGDSGPQVAEVQCLLRRAGISPGGIDGMFGPLTMGAVERFQRQAHLDVDGIAGPHTWKALRG